MFETARRTSTGSLLFSLLGVTYHASVRKVRKTHNNAVIAIGMSLVSKRAVRGGLLPDVHHHRRADHGDPRRFHAVSLVRHFHVSRSYPGAWAVMASENSTSPMMQHAPMNTLVAILSSAISVLYIKTISILVILFVLHTIFQPIEMYDWSGAMMMYLLAWGSGCAIGLILMAFKPWAPDVVTIVQLVYVRANMIASGKMFVANTLPGFMLAMFDWNPLFHIIDQTRGFVFVNYVPHYSNWQYPLYATLFLIMIGMMGEFFTRKRASASWDARR
jgi:xanthosine utilization system XapX-like protein